jgi:hypothetical protein
MHTRTKGDLNLPMDCRVQGGFCPNLQLSTKDAKCGVRQTIVMLSLDAHRLGCILTGTDGLLARSAQAGLMKGTG